jgi:predicted transcriptional regulator
MTESDTKKSIRKLLLHDKPFMLLQTIAASDGHTYSALMSKKIDCSYAYIVKLIKVMNRLGLTEFEETKHKKMIRLTSKGKKILRLLSEV